MGLFIGIILLIVLFKLFFAVTSGIIKGTFALLGFCIFLAILPVSLILLIPIGIFAVFISILIGLLQWIL